MKDTLSGEPQPAPYLQNYMSKARGTVVAEALANAFTRTSDLFSAIPEARGVHRYAEGKWSIKEVLQHLNDCERIFAYRALRSARNDGTVLAPFEENDYALASQADRLPLRMILDEHLAIRRSTQALYASFDDTMFRRNGTAGGNVISVFALGLVIAGHAEHHCDILEQRYH